MTNFIPLIDANSRNLSLRYSVQKNSLSFVVVRFDGHAFSSPTFANDALQAELEKKFLEIVELFEGY
ncbi:MAG: hypothetical protein PHC99_08095 [Methylococcales bacterium]|nr:hypothetical protein [Methylococcales bacterium]